MKVVEKKPIPIYEVTCWECESKIRYMASEVLGAHIKCPVCGISLFASTSCPVAWEDGEVQCSV